MINKPSNWEELEDSEVVVSTGLPVGAYPAQIKDVIDNSEKEYLEVRFDIVKDAKYSNYFTILKENLKLEADVWPNQGIYRASYRETATKYFKAFITAIQKSNQGYVWDWNPKSLKGKYMVANFGEEEYQAQDGSIRIAVKVREIRSSEAWKAGEVKELPLKKLKIEKDTSNSFADMLKDISENDLSDPF